jgi:hypothetical protein
MLIVETIARIRREHFIKARRSRRPPVLWNTVRKVLRSGETSFEYERLVQARPMLGVWAAKLDGLLAANATKCACEYLTLIRIFENCAAGYDGGYDAVRRYARRWSKERGQLTAAAYVPLSFAPERSPPVRLEPRGGSAERGDGDREGPCPALPVGTGSLRRRGRGKPVWCCYQRTAF